ncbi:hypothetical protein J6590_022701 [Homalodisca vitripennis]|nr:hypothetical protein J6590_022701 [Homalodisca vitripennis]
MSVSVCMSVSIDTPKSICVFEVLTLDDVSQRRSALNCALDETMRISLHLDCTIFLVWVFLMSKRCGGPVQRSYFGPAIKEIINKDWFIASLIERSHFSLRPSKQHPQR